MDNNKALLLLQEKQRLPYTFPRKQQKDPAKNTGP